MMKWLGAIMILIGCASIGFSKVAAHRNQQRALQQLIRALDHMSCELEFKMTPLPELCRSASEVCTGSVRTVLQQLSVELESQIIPDAGACIHAATVKNPVLPEQADKCLRCLGDTLGRFDLTGQLQGLENVKKLTQFELEQLQRNQDVRLRSYQTLGICAGAALVLLFL